MTWLTYRRLIGQQPVAVHTGGRPRTSRPTEETVVRLARENGWGSDAWGAKRIVGELKKLGLSIAKSTVSASLSGI